MIALFSWILKQNLQLVFLLSQSKWWRIAKADFVWLLNPFYTKVFRTHTLYQATLSLKKLEVS